MLPEQTATQLIHEELGRMGLRIDGLMDWQFLHRQSTNDEVVILSIETKGAMLPKDFEKIFSQIRTSISKSEFGRELRVELEEKVEQLEKELNVARAEANYLRQYKHHFDLETRKYEIQNSHKWRKND